MPILQKERPALWIEYGIRAISEPDTRWLRCDIKSLNLLPNVLAATKAERKGCKSTSRKERYCNRRKPFQLLLIKTERFTHIQPITLF